MNIKTDSRKVTKGDTFIAIKGINHDGHEFVKEAIKNGATRVVVESGSYEVDTIITSDTRKYLIDYLENNYYSFIKDLCLIGVTGTNGKTTSCYLIYQALNMNNVKCAYIGTIGFYLDNKICDLSNTTPDILDLYEMLFECKEKGYTHVVMEVSSQSLSMNRLDTLYFDFAIFTNLTPEHLDYHKTMENYALAKKQLFNKLKENGKSVVNIDDNYSYYFLNDNSITYGEKDSKYRIIDYKLELMGTTFNINGKLYSSSLIGKYNIYNLLACIIILEELSIDTNIIKNLLPPLGRMEKINYKDNIIIVDYAHTPDAVEKIITNVKKINNGKIYTLIGCGGSRDKSKRKIIGSIASNLSDYVIFTSDNPRNEKPIDILNDMTAWLNRNNYEILPNRRKAIKKGIQLLSINDILLVLGKGHETYQIIGNKKIHFSDKEEILKIIRR